ncbi:glycosyl transferase, partial [Pseudomonas shirazensis]
MERTQQRPFEAPGYLRAAASFCAWACLAGLIALASEMIAPAYLDPSHHLFIFVIGTLGMWRYGNAIVHYLRGMYFLHWRFPRMRREVERLGDAALPSHMFMVVTSFRIPTSTTFKVYQSVFQEVQRLNVPCTVIASIVEKG